MFEREMVSSSFRLQFYTQILVNEAILLKLDSLVEVYLRGIVPDHHNEPNIAIKTITQIVGFSRNIKIMLTLYCSLLSVQLHYVKTKTNKQP